MAKSYGESILTEFQKKREASKSDRHTFPTRQFSGNMTESKMRFLNSRPVKLFKSATRLISHVSTRAYGLYPFSFGAVSLLLYFLNISADMSVLTPVLGALVTLLSIPFLLSDKTLPHFLQGFAVTDYVFFEFFCLKRANKMETVKRIPLIISLLLGTVTALIGLFYPVWWITVVMAAAIFVGITLSSPEFAFFASFLALPYMSAAPYSSYILACVVMLTVFSFLRKSYFGKRVFYIDGYDLVIGAFMLCVLISGVFIKGLSSFAWALGMIFAGLGYTLANNVITNRRLSDRAANTIVISSLPSAIIAITVFARELALGRGGELIDVGVFYGFSTGEAAAVFMIVASVFAVAMMKQSHGAKKAFYSVVFVVEAIALILTGEVFAVLALIIGIVSYYLIRLRRGSVLISIVLSILPYAFLLLPDSFLDTLFSVIPSLRGAEELFSLWGESLSAFAGNLVFGIGIGADSFREEMSALGISRNDSSNLFIEIGLEAGIVALFFFVLLLVVRLCHRSVYRSYVRISEVSTFAPLCTSCVLSLIAYGAFSYIFADLFAGYLFWCVFGIGSAALRVAKKETDDRNQYYEDTRASDSSAIDVEIR